MITREVALRKARQAIVDHRLDALVAASPANVYYTAGTSFMTMKSIPERLGVVSITADGEPAFIYCTIEEGHAKGESWLKNLVGYTEFADRPVEVLARVLREQGAADGRIGLEKRYLVARDFEALQALLPKAELVGADAIFDRMRAIKTSAEIKTLGDAALKTDTAIRAAFAQATVGMTERRIAEVMVNHCKALGGEKVSFQVLAAGSNGFKIHAEPTDTALKAGDILRTDFGMTWGYYLSDMARTAFVGTVTPRQTELYRTLEAVHQEVIAAMMPGVKASDLYRRCVEGFRARGIEFRLPHIGHCIGVVGHENPMLHPFEPAVLEPGMVLMVEPGIMAEDGFYHTEDLVEITATGHRIHSRSADWSGPMVVS